MADNVHSDLMVAADVVAMMQGNRNYVPDPAEQALLCGELLPSWDDDWLITPRERVRNQHVHALEQLCVLLALEGDFGRAIDAGLAAIQADPLSDRAHGALLRAYIADGHGARAVRHFQYYEAMLDAELGIKPDPNVADLVAPLIAQRIPVRRGRWPGEPAAFPVGQAV